VSLGGDGEPVAGGALAALLAQLKASLPPLVLDQMATIGRSLGERNVRSDEAARAWMRATDLTAGRAALLLVGDLSLCVRLAEAEAEPPGGLALDERVHDLIAASVGEGMFAVREQLRLVATPPPSSRPPAPNPTASTHNS
jgi:hypothetical protein